MIPLKPRTLIVDDVSVIRYGISRILQDAGFEIVGLARDGREGVQLAQQHKPELILLDIVMPIMQGLEALPIIRQSLPDALIVMLTSTSERKLALECRDKGANDFIVKQNDLKGLLLERLENRWAAHRATLLEREARKLSDPGGDPA